MNVSEHIDCRGQQCPQPILTTAKAARQMRGRGGGVIEIEATLQCHGLTFARSTSCKNQLTTTSKWNL